MLNNLFRVGWKKKECWHYPLHVEVASFFVTKKCQNIGQIDSQPIQRFNSFNNFSKALMSRKYLILKLFSLQSLKQKITVWKRFYIRSVCLVGQQKWEFQVLAKTMMTFDHYFFSQVSIDFISIWSTIWLVSPINFKRVCGNQRGIGPKGILTTYVSDSGVTLPYVLWQMIYLD